MKVYPSTINRRCWAFVIDCFVILVAAIVISIAGASFRFDLWPAWLATTMFLFYVLAIIFYKPIAEALLDGKTVGKLALGIRVVRSDGSKASGIQCLQRHLMLSIDLFMTFGLGGLISAIITKDRQRFGDLVADTVVVVDDAHTEIMPALMEVSAHTTSTVEKELINRINPNLHVSKDIPPLELAKMHRAVECDIARLRTHKAHPHLIEFMERMLSSIHIGMFRHGTRTIKDMVIFTVKSIPRAVYEARWAVLASLAVAVVSYAIGIYSQTVDPDFFEQMHGWSYTQMTKENIASGNPMGVYGGQEPFSMFFNIFLNNFMVTLKLYVMGIFVVVGPLAILLYNFVSFGTFDTFFAQYGYAVDALVSPMEHGALELSSIIMAGGASLWLGTGWLFPGRLTRLKAFSRSARQSLLIMVSTLPMLFVAAIIECFITRHTEWPMPVKLSIIIVSFIIIVGYYVMLPILSKRQ